MEEERTWIVKFRMSGPQAIPEVPATGPDVYNEADVERLHQRLSYGMPLDSPRQLVNASLEDGTLVMFFETSIEPSEAEYQTMFRFTIAALLPYRRPKKFERVKTFPPMSQPKIDYRP
jgi:hypothetical protein